MPDRAGVAIGPDATPAMLASADDDRTVLRRSPLHDRHVALGAKMADFGGWEMPIEYPGGGVVSEHTAVRERRRRLRRQPPGQGVGARAGRRGVRQRDA